MGKNFFTDIISFVGAFFVAINMWYWDIFSDAIALFHNGNTGPAILGFILGIIGLLVALFVDLLILYGICSLIRWIFILVKTKEIKHSNVIGTVTSKKHIDSHTTFTYVGKVLVPTFHPAEYNIYVMYDDVKEEFDNEELYDQYDKGDSIQLVLVERLDKHGNVFHRTLKLPE